MLLRDQLFLFLFFSVSIFYQSSCSNYSVVSTESSALQNFTTTPKLFEFSQKSTNFSWKGVKVVGGGPLAEPTPPPSIREEWGGNCTEKDWKRCSKLKTYFSYYVDKKDGQVKHYEIDCTIQKILCLKNGWTVTRCQILCMGRCNKDMMSKYDDYVEKEGQC